MQLMETWIFKYKSEQKVQTYGGSISAAMNIFSTNSESILSRCAKLVFTSSFFSNFEGFNWNRKRLVFFFYLELHIYILSEYHTRNFKEIKYSAAVQVSYRIPARFSGLSENVNQF